MKQEVRLEEILPEEIMEQVTEKMLNTAQKFVGTLNTKEMKFNLKCAVDNILMELYAAGHLDCKLEAEIVNEGEYEASIRFVKNTPDIKKTFLV